MRQRFPLRELTTSQVTGVRLALLLERVDRVELCAHRMMLRPGSGIVCICRGDESPPVELPEARQAHQREGNTGDGCSFVPGRDVAHPVLRRVELDLQVVAARLQYMPCCHRAIDSPCSKGLLKARKVRFRTREVDIVDLQIRISGVREQCEARAQHGMDTKSGTTVEHIAGKCEEPVEMICVGGRFLHVDHGNISITPRG